MVADGVGGLHDGYNASHQTVEQLIAAYTSLKHPPNPSQIQQVVEQINHDLFSASATSSATTLTAAWVYDDELMIAHVGDSRAYWVSSEGIQQLTIDHVRQVRNKNAAGTRAHLEQAIGYRPTVEVDLIHRPLDKMGALLLVTDGATRHLSDDDLQRIVLNNPPPQAVEAIIRGANQGGGTDNISAVVVQFERRASGRNLQQHLNQVHSKPLVLDLPDPLTTTLPQPRQVKNRSSLWLGIAAAALIAAGAIAYTFPWTNTAPPTDAGTISTATAQPTFPTDTPLPTQTPPLPTMAPPTDAPLSVAPTDTGLTIDQTVTFQGTEITYTRIGTDVAAFAIVTARPYTVSDQFTDADGVIWYRLQDTQTNQNGWIRADALPDYDLLP
jgi:serine/threonine protein phosphatase PrpC